ncbi:TrmH family RNA methyltransferase [Caenimonas aquaedulcis]|uniref:RNA methyltransferase n=1 Tax=Caenimonas aquaedulcis TaxID=2793270 RepID=A0A931H198_9BURK|nr:RNA methyltransferase [Caenimonas aquaedulcis]
MTTSGPQLISSRDNAWLKDLRRLAQDAGAWRKQRQVWLEGDHLCRAALARGVKPATGVFTESAWSLADASLASAAPRNVVLPAALFSGISGLESPASIGFVLALPDEPALAPMAPTVVLDRVQDAGNVGAILRCASAFGFTQVVALKGTAALWSPKVLRAGMGAHFGLSLIDAADPSVLDKLAVPILTTSSHQGGLLHQQQLPWPCAWAFGHEGQGVGDDVASRASAAVRIVQPGGEESLNVATAAAICLHASAAAAPARL